MPEGPPVTRCCVDNKRWAYRLGCACASSICVDNQRIVRAPAAASRAIENSVAVRPTVRVLRTATGFAQLRLRGFALVERLPLYIWFAHKLDDPTPRCRCGPRHLSVRSMRRALAPRVPRALGHHRAAPRQLRHARRAPPAAAVAKVLQTQRPAS